MRKVHTFAQAEIDIAGHALYLANQRATRGVALRFFEETESISRKLAEFPKLGAVRESVGPSVPTLRAIPVPNFPKYLVLYREVDDGVEILRVLHGSQDIEAILRG